VTVALMRVAVGMQQLGRMIRAGEVESSVLWFARSVPGDQAFERLPEEVRAHVLANASASLGTFLAGVEGIDPISEGEIRSITAPVLVVTGAQSPLPRTSCTFRTRPRSMPDCRASFPM